MLRYIVFCSTIFQFLFFITIPSSQFYCRLTRYAQSSEGFSFQKIILCDLFVYKMILRVCTTVNVFLKVFLWLFYRYIKLSLSQDQNYSAKTVDVLMFFVILQVMIGEMQKVRFRKIDLHLFFVNEFFPAKTGIPVFRVHPQVLSRIFCC